jgi:hypothetical protein
MNGCVLEWRQFHSQVFYGQTTSKTTFKYERNSHGNTTSNFPRLHMSNIVILQKEKWKNIFALLLYIDT